MRISLSLLLALLKLSINVAANDGSDTAEVEQPCRARAWVRAPDLEPGQVIQGDVKVKLDGECGDVSSYTLRLHFVERSWVKTRREGVQLPEDPTKNRSLSRPAHNRTIFDLDSMLWYPFHDVESSVLAQYKEDLMNPNLWLAREEERIGFETKHNLCDGRALGKDVVESFAILVPTTNYPPGVNPVYWSSIGSSRDSSGSEHMYSYFVDVSFVNGTVLEVPAGYTSFNPQEEAATATLLPESFNVTLSQMWPTNNDTDVDVDIFTLEVTFPHGRRFEQGSVNNITIVSHQVGPGKERPDRIDSLSVDISQKRHWAASFAADDEAAKHLLSSGRRYPSQLKPTIPTIPTSRFLHFNQDDNDLTTPKFSQDGAVTNGTMFSTNPVTGQFHVPDNCYPSFHMQYQNLEAELLIYLTIHNTTESPIDDPEDEDYDWTPTVKQPAIRNRIFSPVRIPLFIRSIHEDQTKLLPTEIVHYLSPEARVPIFVDPESVKELRQQSFNERDALTPKAQPIIITHDAGDIVEDRYFAGGLGRQMWYVGDTWFRKVVLPGKKNEQKGEVVGFRVQS